MRFSVVTKCVALVADTIGLYSHPYNLKAAFIRPFDHLTLTFDLLTSKAYHFRVCS